MINPEKFYTISELSQLAKEGFFTIRNRKTIYKLIEDGSLKANNYGAGDKPIWQVKGSDLLDYLNSGSIEKKEIQNKHAKRQKKTKDEKSLSKVEREVQS